MSDHGRNDHTKLDHISEAEGFERSDLTAKAVLGFLAGVVVLVVAAYFIVGGVYRVLSGYERTHEPVQNPLVQTSNADMRVPTAGDAGKFPQPRLEEVERQNLDDARIKEEDILNSYGWMDEKAGVVHIPIERAMQLMEQRRLPARPQRGLAAATISDDKTAKKKDTKAKVGR